MSCVIPIKALSVNEAFYGVKKLTSKIRKYKSDIDILLKACKLEKDISDGDLMIHYLFGVSYFGVDVDNLTKLAQDSICDYFGINDNRFVGITQRKVRVKKGEEFMEFRIEEDSPDEWLGFTGLGVGRL